MRPYADFIHKWPWSTTAVAPQWAEHFYERLSESVQTEHTLQKAARAGWVGHTKQTVVTVFLIFDDSMYTKPKGRTRGGLGRHYSNTEQKMVSDHCLFGGLYVLLGRRFPLDKTPENWTG